MLRVENGRMNLGLVFTIDKPCVDYHMGNVNRSPLKTGKAKKKTVSI